MKALILAAGFGTRLKPFTDRLPKPLFPIAGETVLARMIGALQRAGCSEIAVNAHHLGGQIESFISERSFGLPVHVRREQVLLGTGGAIRNLSDFWDEEPFLVVNVDIVTDIQLADAYHRHRCSDAFVSLVLHNDPFFNQVWIDRNDKIVAFERYANRKPPAGVRKLAFTGIHVVDPRVVDWIPPNGFCDIISVYRRMIDRGAGIRADIVERPYWRDVGTPERFRQAVLDTMAPVVFGRVFPGRPVATTELIPLAGDGSDRRWFRLVCGKHRLIVADHGITLDPSGSEVNAFCAIGRHLLDRGLPVPRIHAFDAFSGLVFLEDLGDEHLQQAVEKAATHSQVKNLYHRVIDALVQYTACAMDGFDPTWTCQGPRYDEALVLDKECRYFVEAFANGYLQLDVAYEDLAEEFVRLARCTIKHAIPGLIHRDLQSRNIMIKNGKPYFIDFQGSRFGPIQYDVASLLIDPYVDLSPDVRDRLLQHAAVMVCRQLACDARRFHQGYAYCRITRNLQMLGAFGYLSRAKGKTAFERWIPKAGVMLPMHIRRADAAAFPRLLALADQIASRWITL